MHKRVLQPLTGQGASVQEPAAAGHALSCPPHFDQAGTVTEHGPLGGCGVGGVGEGGGVPGGAGEGGGVGGGTPGPTAAAAAAWVSGSL
jgi:hypothetical protein